MGKRRKIPPISFKAVFVSIMHLSAYIYIDIGQQSNLPMTLPDFSKYRCVEVWLYACTRLSQKLSRGNFVQIFAKFRFFYF